MNIEVSFELMLLVFIVLIACIYLLNKLLYVPILEFMDSRDSMICGDLDDISKNHAQASVLKSEALSIIESAKKEAEEIKGKAIHDAKALYATTIKEANEEHEKKLQAFFVDLNNERQELKNALLADIGNLKLGLKDKLKNV